ncbi:FUSC family protein [Sinorhizobium medicae]|uniref:Integral membrane bound transporter domain-containing protein n=2 Tax=Sinorhizobium medicae TaxID=110321 RepID=A0A508WYB0_9HYPH|nr:FUSC family protein [Sinorhizobium medicae]MDX0425734.1 FUSC family protein [Sinorhizobium medicae]MDX0524069.1 FUSC family protein [Sinorhizobium medicae]MDX0547844.1 FUSC family protein [Sinorhizobium medicae]MDX0634824.1 FUSC family protein [Sinorhizobium medicae]MDX0715782.1 FUSC family protein [Sinorhizobium medicae]
MTFRLGLRDWLLANDPALSRLRQASRITATVVFSTALLVLFHFIVTSLPPAAYGLAITLSIEGGLAVRDRTASEQLVTRILAVVTAVAMVTLASALEDHRHISDFVFLVIIFVAVYGRAFGQRWFAVGMFAFMSYFTGAYLRPSLDQLPALVLGAGISAAVAHLVRTVLLPDDRYRDLLRAIASVQQRVDDILLGIVAAARKSRIADRRRLHALEERLKESVLMAESFIPMDSSRPAPEPGAASADLAIVLFDIHLAAESVIVLSLQAMPPAALVEAVMARDAKTIEERMLSLDGENVKQVESAKALLWLHSVRERLHSSLAGIREEDLEELPSAQPPKLSATRLSIANPALRNAIQITLASGIAMVFGLMLSRERWFWAVLAAFLVFTNTRSRGDTVVKALQRSAGTLAGIIVGLAAASAIGGNIYVVLPLGAACIFLAFYFLPVSYATMTFFVSVVLSLAYSLLGVLTPQLLELRLEETLIGSVAGAAVAFVVFPTSTRTTLDAAIRNWCDRLVDLLEEAKKGTTGLNLVSRSQALDRAYRDLTAAAKPLGVSWQLVTRPGHVRQTLAVFMGCTYWARIVARKMSQTMNDPAAFTARIEENLKLAGKVRENAAGYFYQSHSVAGPIERHLPVSRDDAGLGLEMVAVSLGRLHFPPPPVGEERGL